MLAEKNNTRREKSDSFDSIPDIGLFKSLDLNESDDKENMSVFKLKEINGQMKPEPILTEDKSRFVLFPIKHTDVSCFFL
jgi:hypothetical protein